MAAERMSGPVKWFSRVKGYGFIAPDGEEREIFVHFTGIEGEGYRNLEKGEKVSFVVEDTDKGPQAVNVRAEGFDVTSWTAEPTDDPAEGPGGETSWRAEDEVPAEEPVEEVPEEAPEEEASEEEVYEEEAPEEEASEEEAPEEEVYEEEAPEEELPAEEAPEMEEAPEEEGEEPPDLVA